MPGSLYQGIRVKGLKMMGHKGVVTRENLGMGINFVSRKKKKTKQIQGISSVQLSQDERQHQHTRL